MNYKSHEHNSNFKKIEPFRKNISQKCQCHCHNNIRNIKKPNNLFLLDEKNINSNLNQRPKLNVIKTETNTNLIKSYVIYKNQIKPLFFSKVAKNNRKNVSNLKKYSYGGKQLKIATNTNNHSFKEIIGRSCSKNKEFKKSRVINYRTEYNSYNFDYSCNNKNNNNYKDEKNNINIVKDIQVNDDKIKKSSSENDLYIKTNKLARAKELYDNIILKNNPTAEVLHQYAVLSSSLSDTDTANTDFDVNVETDTNTDFYFKCLLTDFHVRSISLSLRCLLI